MRKKSIEKLKQLKSDLLFRKEKIDKLQSDNRIISAKDLYGDDDPSLLFPFLIGKFDYLLDPEDVSGFTKESIKKKEKFSKLVRKIGPLFLKTEQIFEDREELAKNTDLEIKPLSIPNEPVIFVSNHGFRDDILGSVLAADRHAYVMFGSLPQFYNTIDGPLLFENGVLLMNRKVKESKNSSINKAVTLLNNGCSLIVFPEGVWNKKPNVLTLPLWRGAYVIAKQSGAKIVPIIHYIKDPTLTLPKNENPFHTVIDNPIDVSEMSEKEALEKISDSFNTWCYLMMEKYGISSRKEMLNGYENADDAWEEQLRLRIKTADRYDFEIETSSDFRPKGIVYPEDAFESIANMNITPKNAKDIIEAKKLVKTAKRNDFQRRF